MNPLVFVVPIGAGIAVRIVAWGITAGNRVRRPRGAGDGGYWGAGSSGDGGGSGGGHSGCGGGHSGCGGGGSGCGGGGGCGGGS